MFSQLSCQSFLCTVWQRVSHLDTSHQHISQGVYTTGTMGIWWHHRPYGTSTVWYKGVRGRSSLCGPVRLKPDGTTHHGQHMLLASQLAPWGVTVVRFNPTGVESNLWQGHIRFIGKNVDPMYHTKLLRLSTNNIYWFWQMSQTPEARSSVRPDSTNNK